jgi:ERCC4-related helicase
LIVLPRGFCLTRIVANYLMRFKTADKNFKTLPYLVFLINFSEEDFEAISFYLNGGIYNIRGEAATTKRLKKYMRGGIFTVSYKVLMLDLVCKRLDPSLITGIIINQKSGTTETRSEIFLGEVLRDENPHAFRLWISNRPHVVVSEGIKSIDQLDINQIMCYHRGRKCV